MDNSLGNFVELDESLGLSMGARWLRRAVSTPKEDNTALPRPPGHDDWKKNGLGKVSMVNCLTLSD
jgi:hypothetical protein